MFIRITSIFFMGFFLVLSKGQAQSSADWIPLKDDRLELELCGSSGGTSEIRNPKLQRVCTGKVKANQKDVVVVIQPKGARVYLEVVKSKLVHFVGGQEGGSRKWSLTVREIAESSLEVINKKTSTLRIEESWMYSEGYTRIGGKTPSGLTVSSGLIGVDEDPDRDY